jgi:hypothetical protein
VTDTIPPDFGPALHRSSPVPLWAQVEESIGRAIVEHCPEPHPLTPQKGTQCRPFHTTSTQEHVA